MKQRLFYFLFILFWIVADQSTKIFISKWLRLYSSLNVLPGLFNITHIRNRGGIFGFFGETQNFVVYLLLTAASLIALGLVVYYFFKTPSSEKLVKISLSLILAGACGNLIDRIFKGYVIDFFDFYIKRWHWPSFNVADACITTGAFLLIAIFFRKKPLCSRSS